MELEEKDDALKKNSFSLERIKAKKPLLILAGPTAVGKTAVSVELAKRLSGECISADSVQVYRGLDIGSAKVTTEEMQGIPHHLIDVLEPKEHYDAVRFQAMAEEAVSGIYERKHLPILVGGTGFYIQALLYGIGFSKEPEEQGEIRARLEKEAVAPGGAERLYAQLKDIDPKSTEKIHAHNLRRIIRALEYYELHGSPISLHNEEERQKAPVYDAAFFVLTDDRECLYERINSRVDKMMEQGLLRETEELYEQGFRSQDSVMQGIGYREMLSYLEGKYSLKDAAELIKKNSRNYAKRQLTWFRRERNVNWVDISEFNYKKDKIVQWITEKCMEIWG